MGKDRKFFDWEVLVPLSFHHRMASQQIGNTLFRFRSTEAYDIQGAVLILLKLVFTTM